VTGGRAFSRRVLLRSTASVGAVGAVGLAAVLTGRSSTAEDLHGSRPGSRDTATRAAGDVALLSQALVDEQRLLAYCNAAARHHPSLKARLGAVRRVQDDHVAVIRRALPRQAHRHAGGHGTPSLPPATAEVSARLLRLVEQAERERLSDCLAAHSGLLARLFASVSASHSVTRHHLGRRR
jgi:hypothetical protein